MQHEDVRRLSVEIDPRKPLTAFVALAELLSLHDFHTDRSTDRNGLDHIKIEFTLASVPGVAPSGNTSPEKKPDRPKRAMNEKKREGLRLVVRVLNDTGHRLSQDEIVEAMGRRGFQISERTGARYLSILRERGRITYQNGKGFGLPTWTD